MLWGELFAGLHPTGLDEQVLKNLWDLERELPRGGSRGRRRKGSVQRAEAEFIGEGLWRVLGQPALWPEIHCSAVGSEHWALGMSEGAGAPERPLSICAADFLDPLPEGEVFHLCESL